MNRAGLAAALLLAALLPGCSAIPPAAIGAVAGAAAEALRLDDDILKLFTGPAATSLQKGQNMASITISTDANYAIPVQITDQVGRRLPSIPAGGSVSLDNTAVATAALSADGATITVTPVAPGSADLTYVNGSLSATAAISVVAPAPTTLTLGQGTLTPIATPEPAAPAAAAAS